MLDLLIRNGKIVDGSGNPWYRGDVGVKDGVIAAVGRIDQEAARTIDAQGRVVAPGFIDGHCHSDLMILDHPRSEIKLRQGVTTEVIGNCGLAPAPLSPQYKRELMAYVEPVLGRTGRPWSWETVGQYMETVRSAGASGHISTFVAHGALRIAVMGFDSRPAADAELAGMKRLLEEGMQAGAIGLSIGLLYAPGSFAPKEEIAELCRVLPKYDGLLSAHIRGEGNHLLASIDEVIWIAERSGVPLHISHLKAAGKSNWGQTERAMERIERARARGMDVTCDVYPYAASSTTLSTVLPPWVLEGGMGPALDRMRDPQTRMRIREELRHEQKDWDNLVASTGWHSIVVSSVGTEANRALEGLHLAQIAELRGVSPEEAMMDLLLEEAGNVAIVYFLMSEDDVRQTVAWDRSLIASDSLYCMTGKPHPRLYGTFPRLFGKYVREDRVLTLEQAVRKVTSFPVQRFRLGKRGLIVPGYAADLAVFDPETIADRATFQEPRQFPQGLTHVIVGGAVTIANGEHSEAQAGTVIEAAPCRFRH